MKAGLSFAGSVVRESFTLDAQVDVAPGEIVAVLGPNGAGKSTMLRTVAGLIALTAGQVTLDRTALDDVATSAFVPARQRPIALVFQDHRLFPHLDVRDNVSFARRSRGQGRAQARASVQPWLERLGLAGLAERRPAQLSGGEAQRVSLARALASDPAALLLDEPTAALDARTRLQVRAELRRHLRSFAGPVLIVTHDAVEAMTIADRLVILEDGGVVQTGTPAEVARHPLTDYVARLVGVNLYVGTPEAATGSVFLDDGGQLVTVGLDDAVRTDGERVLLTVRPSAVTIHIEQPHGSARNVWPGVISDLEPVGDRVRVQVAGAPPALVDVTAAAVADLDLRVGRPVWLSVKATEVHAYAGRSVAGTSPPS